MRSWPSRNSHAALIAIAAWLGQVTCAGPSAPSGALATGVWGGDHVTMTVASGSAQFDFDCAHGSVDTTIVVDGRGQFAATGVFVREHGGPIREGETPDAHPATYTGTVETNTLTLTVRLIDTKETIGSFTLAAGSRGRVVKCL